MAGLFYGACFVEMDSIEALSVFCICPFDHCFFHVSAFAFQCSCWDDSCCIFTRYKSQAARRAVQRSAEDGIKLADASGISSFYLSVSVYPLARAATNASASVYQNR